MRKIIFTVAALILGSTLSSNADASSPYLHTCNTCTTDLEWMLAAADGIMISEGTPYGTIYVGSETTKEVRGYKFNMNGSGVSPIPPGIHAFTPPEIMVEQYGAYVEALRATNGNAGTIVIYGRIASLTEVPQSAFDVTTDGAARQALINHVSQSSNWGPLNGALMFAKIVINNGIQFKTGRDYKIQFRWTLSDQTVVVFNYDSTCQCLKVAEVRDSAGNLIATDSVTPIPVNYESYLQPGASLRPDYARGMGWLNMQGVLITTGSGTRIKTPLVIIGGVVKVAE